MGDGRIGGTPCPPGRRTRVELPLPGLCSVEPLSLPVEVLRGAQPGPTLLLVGGVHGDEILGLEVARRLLASVEARLLRGTLLVAPCVNPYGLACRSRYLPDRRDLNRAFPGRRQGSLAARLAAQLMEALVTPADVVVDVHSGAAHRENLPQIRIDPGAPAARDLAQAFGPPMVLEKAAPGGSLRRACTELGKTCLLYEAGQALRFDEVAACVGARGVLSVLAALHVLGGTEASEIAPQPAARTAGPPVARSSRWLRAPKSGIFRPLVRLGDRVARGQAVATLTDPFGEPLATVEAPGHGAVIGIRRLPLACEGDALLHLAAFDEPGSLPARLGAELDGAPADG